MTGVQTCALPIFPSHDTGQAPTTNAVSGKIWNNWTNGGQTLGNMVDSSGSSTGYSLFAGKVSWQRKLKDAEEWETPKILPESAWNSLLEEMEKRYHRRRARHEDLLLVRSVAARSPKLP